MRILLMNECGASIAVYGPENTQVIFSSSNSNMFYTRDVWSIRSALLLVLSVAVSCHSKREVIDADIVLSR